MKTHSTRASIIAAILLSSTSAFAADPKLHPLESYTAIYEQEGMMVGEYREYCRNYCNERVEVEKFSVNMMGMKLPGEDRKMIAIGEKKFTVDYTKGRVTEFANPFYGDMVARAKASNPTDAAKQYLAMSGTVETSEKATIGQWQCTIWTNAQVGTRLCINDDMVPVLMEMNLAGMQFSRTLIEFRPGDPGPDEIYQVPSDMAPAQPLQVPAGAPPNVKALLESLMPKQ